MNLKKTAESLIKKGYEVSVFARAEEAADYLNRKIDGTTVGIGGSVTLEQMGMYDSLSEHNQVFWHWHRAEGVSAADTAAEASGAEIYLTSAGGISENGEIVNLDGTGNRVASTFFGHKKVYFVAGVNKIEPNLERAVYRVRNVAAPRNAQRLGLQTPCAERADRCYDCSSPQRICSGLAIHLQKMGSCEMEVVLIEEELGF